MKARVRIELPPGAEVNHGVRAKLVERVAAQLGVDAHVDCDHDHDFEKSEKAPPKLRHRAAQEGVDRSSKLYKAMMDRMVADIAAVLSE